MQRKTIMISVLVVLLATLFGQLLLVRAANAERSLFGNAERYADAAHDIVGARALRTDGITIMVHLRDGSSREVLLPQYSTGLNPDESFEFYKVPTAKQVIAYHLYGIPLSGSNLVDERAIAQYFKQSLSDVLHEPTDAHYILSTKGVIVADDAPGQAIDTDSIAKLIRSIVTTLTPRTLSISTFDSFAAVHVEQLRNMSNVAEYISRSKGFQITYGAYTWPLGGKSLVSMLSVATTSGALVVNESKLYAHIKTLANSLITEPMVEPIFTEREGKLAILKKGSEGHDIDIHDLAAAINEYISKITSAIQSKRPMEVGAVEYDLHFITTSPRLTLATLSDLGITGLVGYAKTSFKGSSSDRIHNITLGSERVSGFIVDPGEEFSLVRAIGYSEKENGYKEEYVIKGDRSRKEAGGGLCQVGTTFFRAALDAGLVITERHNHRYVVGYYGPGLDAGIYAIDHDFRFINDFAAPLLVQATPRGSDLVVEFYSRKDGRKSVTTNPQITDVLPPPPPDYRFSNTIPFGKTECTDHPREGLTSYATTTIRYASGDIRKTVWKSEYTPWPKICLIGTGGLNIYQQED